MKWKNCQNVTHKINLLAIDLENENLFAEAKYLSDHPLITILKLYTFI